MIKAVIAGASAPSAGELTRILINHPDVEITAAVDSSNIGRNLSDIHHGLIGEATVTVTETADITSADVIFICRHSHLTRQLISNHAEYPQLHIIDMSVETSPAFLPDGFVFGLSEIYRKPLVRGARHAVIPCPQASVSLISLFPLAAHLMVNSSLSITAEMPADMASPEMANVAAGEIACALTDVQHSFCSDISVKIVKTDSSRGMRISLTLPCPIGIDELCDMYEQAYDDHHFTFISRRQVKTVEVEGTQKCIIELKKDTPESLSITAVADSRMRGGAAEAVHVMNLLFGLHEKTGLALKASAF